ncbi:saccharopine dehydrogenase NADP-binding domain-containing protein [Streptomyces sp. NPDC054787]
MKQPTVMIVGLGNMGGHVLDMLLRRPDSPRVIVAGRDAEHLERRSNLSVLAATHLGYAPNVETAVLDVDDIDRTAETLARLRPDIILSTVSLQAWWVVTELPKPILDDLNQAEIGPWLPMQLTLIYKLMQAVKASGIDVKVANAALPDATHRILASAGLAPTVGIGNVANAIPALRRAAAEELGEPLSQVTVRLVAEHFATTRLPRKGHADGAPFHFSVYRDGMDVTSTVDVDKVLKGAATRYPRTGGMVGVMLTAASAVTVIDALMSEDEVLVHTPGPLSLIGGYPAWVSRTNVSLALPHGLDLEEAKRINAGGLAYEGIEEIREDGSVRYGDKHMDVMKRILGYECSTMRLEDSEAQAKEIAARYAELVRRVRAA